MQHYIFASPNLLDEHTFTSIESMDSACDELFTVTLSNSEELAVLLNLLGIYDFIERSILNNPDFLKIVDISEHKLPELSQEAFDELYELWISKTGRESTMDEYGQLVFIHTHSRKWNQRPNKVILLESYNQSTY